MPNEEMGSRVLSELPDIATRKVLGAISGYLGFVVIAMIAMFFYVKADAPRAFSPPDKLQFPAPSLQTSPEHDLSGFMRDQQRALSRYAWADRGSGVAIIPIEEAMKIVAKRGDRGYDPPEQPAAPAAGPSRGAQP